MMENLTELYCLMDDFCKDFEPKMHEILLNNGSIARRLNFDYSICIKNRSSIVHPVSIFLRLA
nr:hypothetical protein [Candidatus Arsenophonus triatominarum]